jgi:eukaryotic translation initiation factor 2C
MVYERLTDWFYNNENTIPKNILYYHDGVSQEMYTPVKEKELTQIHHAYRQFCIEMGEEKGKGTQNDQSASSSAKLTVVVCTKRHHTQFYPLAKEAQYDNENCKPGTLVE